MALGYRHHGAAYIAHEAMLKHTKQGGGGGKLFGPPKPQTQGGEGARAKRENFVLLESTKRTELS
jgi:hypothetical protein